MDAAVGGERHDSFATRPGQADISQTAFLFQPGDAAVVQGPGMGKQPFLPPGQEHGIEFQALGAVKGHQVDLVVDGGIVIFHDQADVLQEAGQVVEILQREDHFLEVVEPPRRV